MSKIVRFLAIATVTSCILSVVIISIIFMTSDDPSCDDVKDEACKLLDEHREVFEATAQYILNNQIDSVHFYYSDIPTDPPFVIVETKDGNESSATASEYLQLQQRVSMEHTGKFPIFQIIRHQEIVNIQLWDIHTSSDFLRVHIHGFYYSPTPINGQPEAFLKAMMPEQWNTIQKTMDQIDLYQVSPHFIYYHFIQ